LKVPENGLIALNVPLDRLRLGALRRILEKAVVDWLAKRKNNKKTPGS
jgi:hypothetical protein